jgi:hypothetical protein
MTIDFTCPTCGQVFSVPVSFAGTQAMCNTCGAVLTVPTPRYGMAAAPAPLPAPQQPLAGGVPKGVWVAVISVAAAVALLVLLGVVLSSALRGPKTPPVASQPAPWNSAPFNTGGTPTTPGGTQVPAPYVPPQPRPTPSNASGSTAGTNAGSRTSSNAPRPSGMAGFGQSPKPDPESPKPNSSGAAAGDPAKTTAGDHPASSGTSSPTSVPSAADSLDAGSRERSRPGATRPRRTPAADDQNAPSGNDADWVPWRISVDPPATPVDFKKGKISIPVPTAGRVLFPRQPSNFVLVSGRDKSRRETWQVYDLRSSKAIGKSIVPEKHANPELFSPDGRYVLTSVHSRRCSVWSFVEGSFLHELALTEGWGGELAFAGPHQLLSTEWKSSNGILRLFDLRTGDKLRELSIPAPSDRRPLNDSLTVTPGGRYALVLHSDRLAAYDLNENQCVGHAQLPGAAQTCQATACTPDGEELAALVTLRSGKLHLVCWDLGQGRISLDYEYDDEGQGFRAGRGVLSWLLDKSGLLYQGNILLDRETGAATWEFPSARGDERRMLSLSKMLATVDGRNANALTTLDLPEKDLKKALESVRGGGKAVDAALPRLIKGNVLSASAATLPNGFVDWAAEPDAAGALARREPRDLLVAKEGESSESTRTLRIAVRSEKPGGAAAAGLRLPGCQPVGQLRDRRFPAAERRVRPAGRDRVQSAQAHRRLAALRRRIVAGHGIPAALRPPPRRSAEERQAGRLPG